MHLEKVTLRPIPRTTKSTQGRGVRGCGEHTHTNTRELMTCELPRIGRKQRVTNSGPKPIITLVYTEEETVTQIWDGTEPENTGGHGSKEDTRWVTGATILLLRLVGDRHLCYRIAYNCYLVVASGR